MEKLKFRIYAQANKPHQVSAAKSFAEGVEKHGHFVTWDNSPADVFVSWGLRSPFRNIGKPWVCLAAGYINGTGGSYTDNRLRFISANFGGIGNACVKAIGCSDDRAQKHRIQSEMDSLKFADFYEKRDRIVFFGQVANDASFDGIQYEAMLARDLSRYSRGMDIPGKMVFRPHPLSSIRFDSIENDDLPLQESLARAACTISHTSTAAVAAIMAGVPSIVLDKRSIAWPMNNKDFTWKDIEKWVTGKTSFIDENARWKWISDVMYQQWTHSELEDGEAWEHLEMMLYTKDPFSLAGGNILC